MARQPHGRDFATRLGRIFGWSAVGFALVTVTLAFLEQMGLPGLVIGYLLIAFTLLIYLAIGFISRNMLVSQYYVAGRGVPAFYNGLATAAGAITGTAFLGLAAAVYPFGYGGLAYLIGLASGYLLIAILIGPYLRRFGAYTVADFLAARFGSDLVRLLAGLATVIASFPLLIAQIALVGLIAERFLGFDYRIAVSIGLTVVIASSVLGGMRAAIWTEVAQYLVLILAFLIPVAIVAGERYGSPAAQILYGRALTEIAARESDLVARGAATLASLRNRFQLLGEPTAFNAIAIGFSLIAGTASLPHILTRSLAARSVRNARQSTAWSLLFVALFLLTVPAYAAFARLSLATSLFGHGIADLGADEGLAWLFRWGAAGLVHICGAAATSAAAVAAACGGIAGHGPLIRPEDVRLEPDLLVLALPDMAGQSVVVTALAAAGALAAALASATALTLTVANSISRDLYEGLLDKRAPNTRRLVLARIGLILVAAAAAYPAVLRPADPFAAFGASFSLAAAGLFPALILGLWWSRTSAPGAALGIFAGLAVTLLYLLAVTIDPAWGIRFLALKPLLDPTTGGPLVDVAAALAGPEPNRLLAGKVGWFNLPSQAAAILGVPVGFAVMIAVSLMRPAPTRWTEDFLDTVRAPAGEPVMTEGMT